MKQQIKAALASKQGKTVAKALVIGTVALAGTALAQSGGATLDPSGGTGVLSGTVTSGIVAVGSAIFTLAALAMGVSWIKATFFG